MTTDTARVDHADSDRLPLETGPDSQPLPRSFYSAPVCADLDDLDAQVAFLGVPYDYGAVIAGSRSGPNGIRDTRGVYAYNRPSPEDGTVPGGYYDYDADRHRLRGVTMADCGDVSIVPGDVERNFWRVTRAVRQIVSRGSLLVTIGGDHSITSPVVRGFDSYPQLDIVHFDAHLDYKDHFQGIPWVNGAPIRRCSEFPFVRNITQVGIRAGGSYQEAADSRARGNRIVTSDQFRELGPTAVMDLVPESDAMYVTIDIDVMDPSVCPGTGSPEPGGLTYLEMRSALRALAGRGKIVGIDLVELAASLDSTGNTARTGSKLLIDLLTAIFDK